MKAVAVAGLPANGLRGLILRVPVARSRALWVAAVYAIFATLWIYGSERFIGGLFHEPKDLVVWSTYKGLGFVAVTSALLLVLMRWVFGSLEHSYRSLVASERDLRRHEEALQDLNESLEVKVDQRTKELEHAVKRAESADRTKSAFLATMSHELRTPLNSILGFTGLLLQGRAGPLNAEQEKQLGMVRGSARHLLELINDTLDISKIEAGQLDLEMESFNIRESVKRCVESMRPAAERKGLSLAVECGEGVCAAVGDKRRVEQILLNLLSNAVKFTEVGGVSVKVEGGAGLDGVVVVKVRDSGVGIPPDEIGRIFRPFVQVGEPGALRAEGTGLGLAISARLAAMMGGSITVESPHGRGSEFLVELPLAATQKQEDA